MVLWLWPEEIALFSLLLTFSMFFIGIPLPKGQLILRKI
jgi:hypothetical protein